MSIASPDFDFISTLVRKEAAIVLEPGKEYLVESRLGPLAKEAGLETIVKLVETLRKNTDLVLKRKVIEAMTTNETSFFRDLEPFEILKNHVIPDLLEKRKATKTLNMWCAASSTGQEPYSTAICLRENFPQLASWKVKMLATDINSAVIDKARKGAYSQIEINRGLPVTLLVKYFTKNGNTWNLKDDIRNMIEFKELNLVQRWPLMATMDIVFIRNVLIYFDIPTKKEILGNIRKGLAKDGYLFLGAAETTLNLDENFQRSTFKKGGCYVLKP